MNVAEDAPQDDFKWFGEGFDGFPKRLPDDTVEYAIFKIDNVIDTSQQLTYLRKVLQEFNTFTKDLLKDYIWQRDSFALELKVDNGHWSLQGTVNFSDSIADEWLIVYILLEMSKKIPDIFIRVYDNDGEFLLIEAANALPRWLKPEISQNRVWIHAGEIRIIPTVAQSLFSARSPSLQEAISFIKTSQNQLFRSVSIESEAFYRIKKYPKAIAEQFHDCVVRLPRKVAYILHQKAAYISPAIEAFYLRDPISLKPLINHKSSDLVFPPVDLIKTSIRFTRVGYAQLQSQEFQPPTSWTQIVETTSEKELQITELGMKITCGLEMLVSDKFHQDKRAVREIKVILEDLNIGEDELPSDADIAKWSNKDDSDDWMNIDFNDFDRELAGRESTASATNSGGGFRDKTAQENLRKMVSRVEEFLNDNEAGLDGAREDDSDSEDFSGSDEDEDVSFNEEEFAAKMREMMGIPAEELTMAKVADEYIDSDDEAKIKENMTDIEAELREAGVLNVEPVDVGGKKKGKQPASLRLLDQSKSEQGMDDREHEDIDENVNIDFALAKNLLEAFKSQGGMSGPAGNLMGLMGVRLPPDKEESDK